MSFPIIILVIQTLFLWCLALIIYHQKKRLTLIPTYAFIAVLTIATHNISDLNFAVFFKEWVFMISSVSFFTTMIFLTLILYLLEGPRAARTALWIILFSSILYIFEVFLIGLQVDTSSWVQLNQSQLSYYFWSILATIIDVVFMAVIWEMLSKIKFLPLTIRVFLIIFGVMISDSFIFITGFFGKDPNYFNIVSSSVITRSILSLIGTVFVTFFLKSKNFTEENRQKPKQLWEILNFSSNLEIKIKTLEEAIETQKKLEEKIINTQEAYELALTGAGAGIWDWDVVTNKIVWSDKFCQLIGYAPGQFEGNLDAFKKILHPQDQDKTWSAIDECFKNKTRYEIEYRLKTKSGKYQWFFASGVTKYDSQDKAIRMVGSIINIDEKKQAEVLLKEKVDELTKLNEVMMGRELKMIELKQEIVQLKKG